MKLALSFVLCIFATSTVAQSIPRYVAQSSSLVASEVRIGADRVMPLLAEGLTLEAVETTMSGPRFITFSGDRLLVGSNSGTVYWLDPPYRDANELVSVNGYPHSVAVRGDKIYVALSDRLLVAAYAGQSRLDRDAFSTLVTLPGGGGHSSRTVKVGPDNRLYISLGIAGNCSDQMVDERYPFTDRRGGLFVVDETGNKSTLKPWASGLRNPIGYNWNPDNGLVYATNNGPDHLGYDQPPEQLVELRSGSFHGMPWFQHDGSKFFRDNCVGSDPPASLDSLPPPTALFPARNAPMDLAFIPRDADHPYAGDAIVALHGSWATSDAAGGAGSPDTRRPPGIVRVEFDDDKAIAVHDVVQGMQLEDGSRWARPGGVAIGPDGHIYFTSDAAINGLYRLRITQD